MSAKPLVKGISFQYAVQKLNEYWSSLGCVVLQPYDMEVGAGTFHPYTCLHSLGKKPLRIAHVQLSRRPGDGRYGQNPNRLYRFHQYQVLIKPSVDDIIDLYLGSLKVIGIDHHKHDIRFVEDDWESPTLGASGLGWEVWCNGAEISQFTYFQQVGGISCDLIPVEIAYGLDRIIMYVQGVTNVFDIAWNNYSDPQYNYTLGDIAKRYEYEMTSYCLLHADTEIMRKHFVDYENELLRLIELKLPLAAYEQCIRINNIFNILDSRSVLGVQERAQYIANIRNLSKLCCQVWCEIQE